MTPDLFSLCSSNKIQAFFPMDEIINSRRQNAYSSVSWFMARGDRSLLPRLSMVKCINCRHGLMHVRTDRYGKGDTR